MTMTKKEYDLIAKVLKSNYDKLHMLDDTSGAYATGYEWAIEPVIQELADELEKVNYNFDKQKFLQACGLAD